MIRHLRWVPECRGRPVGVAAAEFDPSRVCPAVSVQAAWNRSRGIIRGLKDAQGRLLEDHIGEELDAAGVLRDAGRRIPGAREMRAQVWTVEQHLHRFRQAHPERAVVAWVGNGNLLSNPHFVGYDGGTLFHLRGEEREFPFRRYSALVVRRDGAARRAAIEDLDLSAPLPSAVECFTTGQRLVRDGYAAGEEELAAMARAGEFYDLRHLFLFGRIARGEERWIDAGLEAFWRDGGTMNREAVARAARGEPVEADAGQFGEAEVRAAMEAKGYRAVGAPRQRGEYSLRNGRLTVALLEGIYPHNLLGVKADGTLLAVAVGGLSNRAGVTLGGAAALLRELGARDALLIDNGADVMLWFEPVLRLGPAGGARNRLRSILVFWRRADRPPGPADARLTLYAPAASA